MSLAGVSRARADDDGRVRRRPASGAGPTFAELRELRDALRTRTGLPLPHLSMGMSNDFEVAVEEGATFVRVGTTLFEGLESRRM